MMLPRRRHDFDFFDDMLKAQKCFEKMKEKYNEVFLTRTI